MPLHSLRLVSPLLLSLLTLFVPAAVVADDTPETSTVEASGRIPVAGGHMAVCWKAQVPTGGSVLVHFHGAVETVQRALARSDFRGVLVVVNFPGLSSAYSTPVAGDGQLLDRILRQAWVETHDASEEDPDWDQIWLSSFSAGYGAVREILKSDHWFERIDAIIAADSIYAGLETTPEREVDAEHMRDFLRFARLAALGQRRFVLSHSAQPTSYASTTETADYLLHALDIQREPDTSMERDRMRQQTRAARGGFLVLGFEGTTRPDHLRHLRNIDLLWDCSMPRELNTSPLSQPAAPPD